MCVICVYMCSIYRAAPLQPLTGLQSSCRQGNLINSYIQEQSRRDERLLSVLETLVARDSSKPLDLWAPQQQQLHSVDSMCHSQPADAPHSETRIRESTPNLRGMPQSRVNYWPQQAVAESRAAPSEEHGSQTSPTKVLSCSPIGQNLYALTAWILICLAHP